MHILPRPCPPTHTRCHTHCPQDHIKVVARKELRLARKFLHGPSGGSANAGGPIPMAGFAHTWRLDKDEPTSTFNLIRG